MHTLIAIGPVGKRRIYIDMPRETAITRWSRTTGDAPTEDLFITEFVFTDEFGAYDVQEA